jgi:hypothetical protein
MRFIFDNRVGNLNKDIVCEDCSVDKALMALNELDGERHTLLSLERPDGWQLCVGGGPKGFIVTLSSQSGKNLTLLNVFGNDEEAVELCAGGQFSDFPLSIVVDKDLVAKAIASFFEKNEKKLEWDSD